MKNLKQILTTLAVAIFMFSSFSGVAQNERTFPPIDIKFGYAAGPFGCVAFSLCSVVIGSSEAIAFSENSARGMIRETKDGKLEIYMQYNEMDKTSRNSHFTSKRTFEVTDDFYLDPEVSLRSGLSKKQHIIKKGVYKIRYAKDGVKIIF